jgi:hypothetical protein
VELRGYGEELDYLEARPGDHLICPFECDICNFQRMKGRTPDGDNAEDKYLIAFIRRANLDAFWSRRPSTVKGLNAIFSEQVAVGERFGFQMFEPRGPFTRRYDSGMKAAIGILVRSQRKGLHEEKMKFSSVRKARTLHTDMYNSSARAVKEASVWRSDRARFATTKAPTDSSWFNAFMNGYRARVGERQKQDVAISIELVIELQQTLEEDWNDAEASNNREDQRRIAEHGAYYLFLYCGSLRGFEGPKVTLSDLRRQIVAPGTPASEHVTPHIGLPLSGRFKARSQYAQEILIPIAYTTVSGLEPGKWAERLIRILESQHKTTGWAFSQLDNSQSRMGDFEDDFYERLLRIQQSKPHLFTEGIEITEDYHLSRSFRRGATTRATAAGVSASDIEYINRWNIGADSIGGPMRVLYTDKTQLTNMFLRFSLAL